MAIFDPETTEKAAKGNKEWIKAQEFDSGVTVQIKGTEKVKSAYGASAENALVDKDILEEGESFRYTFVDAEGNERKHDSTSFPMFICMQNGNIDLGDWLYIKRDGKGDKTRYSVEKVAAPTFAEKVEKAEIDPSEIPF